MNFILKTALPVLIALAVGFVGGLLFVETPEIDRAAPATKAVVSQPQTIIVNSAGGGETSKLTLAQINDEPIVFNQVFLLYQYALQSDLDELEAAVATFTGDPDPLFNRNAVDIMLERMTALNPERALAVADRYPGNNRNGLITHILTSWIRNDPEPALDYFRDINNQQLQFAIGARLLADPTMSRFGLMDEVREVLGSYGERVEERIAQSRTSPELAFEQAFNSTDPDKLNNMMRAAQRWFAQDPDTAIQRISLISNPQTRTQLMQVAISSQAQQDPASALEMIATYAPGNRQLRQQALRAYATLDPTGALPSVEAFVAETNSYSVMGILVARWMAEDQSAALAYIDTIAVERRPEILQRVAFDFVRRDPVAGMEWAMALPGSLDQSVKQSAISVLRQHPAVAENWITRLADQPSLQGSLLQQVAQHKASSNPAAALSWLESYGENPAYNNARITVMGQWAQQDPDRVATLIEEEADNPSYQHIYQQVANAKYQRDSREAERWFASLPPGPGKQGAFYTVMDRTDDPASLVPLIRDMPRSAQSDISMQLAYYWLRKAPDAVNDIVSTLNLNEEQQAQLNATRRSFSGGLTPHGSGL